MDPSRKQMLGGRLPQTNSKSRQRIFRRPAYADKVEIVGSKLPLLSFDNFPHDIYFLLYDLSITFLEVITVTELILLKEWRNQSAVNKCQLSIMHVYNSSHYSRASNNQCYNIKEKRCNISWWKSNFLVFSQNIYLRQTIGATFTVITG